MIKYMFLLFIALAVSNTEANAITKQTILTKWFNSPGCPANKKHHLTTKKHKLKWYQKRQAKAIRARRH